MPLPAVLAILGMIKSLKGGQQQPVVVGQQQGYGTNQPQPGMMRTLDQTGTYASQMPGTGNVGAGGSMDRFQNAMGTIGQLASLSQRGNQQQAYQMPYLRRRQ